MVDQNLGFIVASLESVGVERWFEIGKQPPQLREATAGLRATLESDGLKSHFRLVALDTADKIRAKVGGYLTANGRLTFWAVYHRLTENAATRRALTQLLVSSCISRACSVPTTRYVETQPAHDTPELEIFEDAIRAQGLIQIAESRLYQRNLECKQSLEPSLRERGIRFVPYDQLEPQIVTSLFDAVRHTTLDRAERHSVLTSQETLTELRVVADSAGTTRLWSIALKDGVPSGYLLCALSEVTGGESSTGTIVEIGVINEARRQGIGRFMLTTAIEEFRLRGARTAEALIDVVNTSSIRLHQSLGFSITPGSYWTWRRILQ